MAAFWKSLVEHAAGIIQAIAQLVGVSDQTALGILALLIIFLAFMGGLLLRGASRNVKAAIFVLMLFLVAAWGLVASKPIPPPPPEPMSPCLSFIGIRCPPRQLHISMLATSGHLQMSNNSWSITTFEIINDQEATLGTWSPGYSIHDGQIKHDKIWFNMAVNLSDAEYHATGTCRGNVVSGQMHLVNRNPPYEDYKADARIFNWDLN
jgi:hypothetical protein